ncbi:MAG: hypothetical protein KME14_20555 [Tildeniella torsiva UHER 1998/13D]|jgi:hypothetical protein|nr:hypothetical protein [Tildeniella torsiva UHER 1998/13D]
MGVGRVVLVAPLVLGLNGCLGLWALNAALPEVEDEPVVEAVAEAEPEPETDYLQAGKERAYNAAVMAQTASNVETWNLVAERWAQAIAQLKLVPMGHPDEAEARAKIEEYRVNLQVATTRRDALKPATAPVMSELDQFIAWVREIDPNGTIVAGAKVRDDDPDILEVTVTVGFLAQNKEVQREGAAGLQRGWALVSNPTKPDSAYLWLRTPSGKRFGGSRAIGGTLIYIDD